MPKLIDYPRTTYSSAWEVAEITDDTGGKCAIETAARKLNRKVSGSFKAIIGSAVKFGLLTSKRDVLTTTTLFKRIKHAYDKQEELVFHREAFLTPPLFTQLCRKFRSRELPVQMLDVMLIREFGVEEINAQGVAKAFVEGCRMVGLLNEDNIIADIDALAAQRGPRREIASPIPTINIFRAEPLVSQQEDESHTESETGIEDSSLFTTPLQRHIISPPAAKIDSDAIASLFGFSTANSYDDETHETETPAAPKTIRTAEPHTSESAVTSIVPTDRLVEVPVTTAIAGGYQLHISGPGVNSNLSITEEEDISIAISLLEKIRRQLRK